MRIGISTRALFDLEAENALFDREGADMYDAHQVAHEHVPLKPGTAFPLVKGLLALNAHLPEDRRVEVTIMSRNSADVSLRIFESCRANGLDIKAGAFTRGRPLSHYLRAYDVDLFLSREAGDVQAAIDAGMPAALVMDQPVRPAGADRNDARIAFDADCVLFSEESQRIYAAEGLDAFEQHERDKAMRPIPPGPHARLLRALADIQRNLPLKSAHLRVAIVTARGYPSHERLVRTLRSWDVRIDEAFFMNGQPKNRVLEAFGADIFFDDQEKHLAAAAGVVPSARVPYASGSPLVSDSVPNIRPSGNAPSLAANGTQRS
jgi:5'-nucleotidase